MLRWFPLLLVASLSFPLGISAAEVAKAGAISIKDAWSRATPQGAEIGVGYLTIVNDGDTPDRLVAVDAGFAGQVEIHQMKMADGVRLMRPVPEGVIIPAKGSVAFSPESYHLMFTGLKSPLKEDETVAGTLTFEHAGKVPVTFHVESMGASEPEGAHHH